MNEEEINITDIDQLDSRAGHYAVVQHLATDLAALCWRGFQGKGRGAAVVKLFDYWKAGGALKTEIEYQSIDEPRLRHLLEGVGESYVQQYRPESEYVVVIMGREQVSTLQVPSEPAGLPMPVVAEANRRSGHIKRAASAINN